MIEAAIVEAVRPNPAYILDRFSNMIAATVAQELRIKGPAYTVDAACASALVALADEDRAVPLGWVGAARGAG